MDISEHLKWATKQKSTTYSVLSITNYALQFFFSNSVIIIHYQSSKGSSKYKMVYFIKEMAA